MPWRKPESTSWRPGWQELGLAVTLFLVGIWMLQSNARPGVALTRASYDLTFALDSAPVSVLAESPVVIVYLDLESYQKEKQDPTRPWDRALHAQLVRRLKAAGAKSIIFDIVFSDRSPRSETDQQFADALRAAGSAILAAEWSRSSRNAGAQEQLLTRTLSRPTEPLLSAAAGFGFAFTQTDDDLKARRFFPGFLERGLPTLTWAAAQFLKLPLDEALVRGEGWIRYYGRPLTIPHVSYSDAVQPGGVPDQFFANKYVLVGARSVIGGFDQRRDELRNPYSTWTRGELFMPGVEVHATQLLNILHDDWLRRFSTGAESAVLAGAAVVIGVSMSRARIVGASVVAVLAEAAVVSLAAYLFNQHRIWFPWLIVAGVQIPAGLLWSAVSESLTWYRQKQQYLHRIKQQATLIDKARDVILVTDLRGIVVYANPTAKALLGSAVEENANAWELFCGGDQAGQAIQLAANAVLRTGQWRGELQIDSLGDGALLIAMSWTLIEDPFGKPSHILSIGTDITERRRLEEQVAKAQRLETIGTLASGMTHDLNNALAPVLMGLQALHRRVQDPSLRSMIGIMESNTRRGAEMVRQVLLFSRGQTDELQSLPVNSLVRDTIAMLRQIFGECIQFNELLADDLWPVRGNSTQLQQLLVNLCLNSRDAMPQGGKITIASDNVELTSSEASAIAGGRAGRFVLVMVSDTGSGMSPDTLRRIFEPFFTTKPVGKGTGLGLLSVQHILKQHSGFVQVQSQVGEGTVFEVYLPAFDQDDERVSLPVVNVPPGRGEWILVMDDEQSVRDFICSGLEENGYQVIATGNCLESLAVLQRDNPSIRLVIADWRVPGMDVTCAAVSLRAVRPKIPFLIVSGALPDETDAGWPLSNPTATLLKPFRLGTLLEHVRTLISRSPPT